MVLVRLTTEPSVRDPASVSIPVELERDDSWLGVLSGEVMGDSGGGLTIEEPGRVVGRAELSTETVSVNVAFTVVIVVFLALDDVPVPLALDREVSLEELRVELRALVESEGEDLITDSVSVSPMADVVGISDSLSDCEGEGVVVWEGLPGKLLLAVVTTLLFELDEVPSEEKE